MQAKKTNTGKASTSSQKITDNALFTERHYRLEQALDLMSEIDPNNVQATVASQIKLMDPYYEEVLTQAKRSFRWALVSTGVGLFFFMASVGFILSRKSEDAAKISLVSGAIIEVIAGINFYLHNRASKQLTDFHNRLENTQRFLLANVICEQLSDDVKHEVRSDVIRVIA